MEANFDDVEKQWTRGKKARVTGEVHLISESIGRMKLFALIPANRFRKAGEFFPEKIRAARRKQKEERSNR